MSTFTIFVNKCQKSIPIDFEALPAHIQQHIIEYGLTQKINDTHSGEEDKDTAWGLVENLVERLQSGDISKRAAGKDPVVVEATHQMRAAIRKASNMKAAEVSKLGYSQLIEMIAKGTGKTWEEIMEIFCAKAKKVVALRGEAEPLDMKL